MEQLSKVSKVTQVCVQELGFEPSATYCQGFIMEDMERLHLSLTPSPMSFLSTLAALTFGAPQE